MTSVAELGINVEADAALLGARLTPRLVHFEEGGVSQHVTTAGADYRFSQLDYYDADSGNSRPLATRMIATLLAGHRTELAYWTQAASAKALTAHRGLGHIVFGKPENVEPDEGTHPLAARTQMAQLHPTVMPTATLQPGTFYVIEAALWTPEPFVISGLYPADTPVDWPAMEIAVEPGHTSVEAPEGTMFAPDDFAQRYAPPAGSPH